MPVTDISVKEATEAHIRRLMARRAGLPLTWETRAERAELLAEINATLEMYVDMADG